MAKSKYKGILDRIISKAVIMTSLTDANKNLDVGTKLIQKATCLAILEPAFKYMEKSKDENLQKVAIEYKQAIQILKDEGVIETVNNIEDLLDGQNNENSDDKAQG